MNISAHAPYERPHMIRFLLRTVLATALSFAVKSYLEGEFGNNKRIH